MDEFVLCGASSYEQKYYFNEKFSALPESVKHELKLMCVSFVEEAGGILTMEFNAEGDLLFKVTAADGDYLFDDIEAGIQISRAQKKREDTLRRIELYYKVMILGQDIHEITI